MIPVSAQILLIDEVVTDVRLTGAHTMKNAKKLQVKRETLRELSPDETQRVVGGCAPPILRAPERQPSNRGACGNTTPMH